MMQKIRKDKNIFPFKLHEQKKKKKKDFFTSCPAEAFTALVWWRQNDTSRDGGNEPELADYISHITGLDMANPDRKQLDR